MTSMLEKVTATRKDAAIRMIVHGQDGCGKSTFASCAPSPIFIAAESGLLNLDAKAFPEPKVWDDVIEQVDAVAAESHDYRTLVLDSVDWIEPVCWDFVCQAARKKSIEAFDYGKGFVAATDQWRILLKKLEHVHGRGINIILIAHSVRKSVRNPEGSDWERWQIKLHEKAAGLLSEWVDVVAYASHEVLAAADKSGRVKGLSTGRRILRTSPNAAYAAKTRFALPEVLPLDWNVFERAVAEGRKNPIETLTATFEAKLETLGDAEVERGARSFLEERGLSVASLTDAIETVSSYLSERNNA